MTATTRGRHRRARPRRRVRLTAMEVLGFIDLPGPVAGWTTSQDGQVVEDRPAAEQPEPLEPPAMEADLADWSPAPFHAELVDRRIRRGSVIGAALIAAVLGAAGYWAYTQPGRAAAAALADVTAEAAALSAHLGALHTLGEALTESPTADTSLTPALSAADEQARALFDAAAALPPSMSDSRMAAADAASDVLDATRLIGGAAAYRAAVAPILAVPTLETDPAAVSISEAALAFGDWQAGFDEVRAALPAGALSEVSAKLQLVSAALGGYGTRYLDAIRADDREAAKAALESLSERLEEAATLLSQSTEEARERAAARLSSASESIEVLLG